MENNVLSAQTPMHVEKALVKLTPHHRLVSTCHNLCGSQHCILCASMDAAGMQDNIGSLRWWGSDFGINNLSFQNML